MDTLENNKKRLYKALIVLVIILSAYSAVLIYSEIRKDAAIGEASEPATISFSGHGEVTAVPDIANISFTISKDDKTVSAAQADVASVEKNALTVLKNKGIADTDIKTTDASVYPKYEYNQTTCPATPPSGGITVSSAVICRPGNQVLVGYTASESITVKVRQIDTAGDVMQALGTTGVSNLSGPNFSIDNKDAVNAQARQKAIDDAKTKAVELAKELGVSLGKITSFSESGSMPTVYAAKAMFATSSANSSDTASLPVGENTISSDVNITYEIK